jgi:hypothetical protein
MSEENPIVTWAVQLTGSAGTLRRWEGLFTDPHIAIVEGHPREGADGFSLRSARFDGLPGSEIQGVAADLVEKMNSVIAQFGGAAPVSVGLCLAIFADGRRGRPVVMDFTVPIDISATSGTITFDEAEKAQVLRWLRLAEREDYVADALRFLHRGTWFDLYFACEVLGHDCGDQHKLMQRQWAQQYELELVKQNANLYRHARPTSRPSRLLSLPEARGLLERAIRAWLAEKS